MTDGSWTSWRPQENNTFHYFTGLSKSTKNVMWLYFFCPNLVVLVGLKIRQRGVAGSGERHDFDPSVHQSFVVQLLEHPPKRKINSIVKKVQKFRISKRLKPGQVVVKRKLSQKAKLSGWSQIWSWGKKLKPSTVTTDAPWWSKSNTPHSNFKENWWECLIFIPDSLHEPWIESLVVILEVNPPSHSLYWGLETKIFSDYTSFKVTGPWNKKQRSFNHWHNRKMSRYEYIFRLVTNILLITLFLYFYLPLVGISHDDASALLVVLSNAHLRHVFRPFDPQRLIDLILLQIIRTWDGWLQDLLDKFWKLHLET